MMRPPTADRGSGRGGGGSGCRRGRGRGQGEWGGGDTGGGGAGSGDPWSVRGIMVRCGEADHLDLEMIIVTIMIRGENRGERVMES